MDAAFWVAAAFVVFVGVLWYLGAFKTLIASLDNRAEAIRKELEEAKALREEAQRVFQEYKKKFAAAEHEADEIIARAQLVERSHIVAHIAIGRPNHCGGPCHDMIAREEQLLFLQRKAQMIGGMAGREECGE